MRMGQGLMGVVRSIGGLLGVTITSVLFERRRASYQLFAYQTYDSAALAHGETMSDLRRLLQAQKDLLDAIIHMVAGAIDAKSPYTHGHCQRVPEIARDLAESAHEATDGPFADFELSDDECQDTKLHRFPLGLQSRIIVNGG